MRPTRTELLDWSLEPLRGSIPDAVRRAGAIPAVVPGTVHTDLLAAGLIEDPFLDDNEALQAWIGRSDWLYSHELEWTPDGSDRQELVFDGLDTVADIRLNGVLIAATRNQHRAYRFNVTDLLRAGSNDLEIEFISAVRAADSASLALGARPHANHHPYNALRKSACSFGWDWGIDTATAGIWRPCALETWSVARLGEVRVAGTVIDGVPTAQISVEVLRTSDVPVAIAVRVAGAERTVEVPTAEREVELLVPVPGAELWWPTGHGRPALHDLDVRLLAAGNGVVDEHHHRVGFRTVEARLEADESGVGFSIVVNGESVFVRGANWIPDDAFPHRVDRARYAARIAQAEFARINLLRVWGGGIYESDDFFAECDERGILVWQDFLFACAAYAEEEPLRSEIEVEARQAIIRLGAHPSLAVLNGNNENAWGRQDWGWEGPLEGRSWGAGYYYELLPGLVAELAPHVVYTPASPFSPDPADPQNDVERGTAHLWDIWNERDYTDYRDHSPRFVSEFGWQGPPTWSTLTRAISDDPLTPESPGMLVHQKAANGNDKLTRGLVTHLPLPNDMADWHWAMSWNQANAVRTAVEWFRSLSPRCAGSIVWQLNDSWPVTSWSAVDGDGREKPMLHALRAAHAERLLTIQPSVDGLHVVAVNDMAQPWLGEVVVERIRFDGTVLARSVRTIAADARDTVRLKVESPVASADETARELVRARAGGVCAHWFFAEPRLQALPAHDLDVHAERSPTGWNVHVTANVLVRDLTLLIDRIAPDAKVAEGLVSMLPGDRTVFHVIGATAASAADLSHPSVLRSPADLLHPAKPPRASDD